MSNGPARILIPVAVIILLSAAGIIDLSMLPWNDTDFQVTLATIVVYLVWSVLSGSSRADAGRITLYAVLLVSILDSFMLRITAFREPFAGRWAGVAILTAGCVLREAYSRGTGRSAGAAGRIGQMSGLALGLGSLAGLAVSIFPGIPSALKEKNG